MSGGSPTEHRPVSQSLQEYARGVTGGLLFSLPLLFTSELWQAGHVARSSHLIAYLFVIFALLLGYNRHAGMRRDANWAEVAIDSVEEMGLGLVIAAGTLWLSGRIRSDMPVNDVLGQILIAAMTVAVGVSVGTSQLGADEKESREDAGMEMETGTETGTRTDTGRSSREASDPSGNDEGRIGGQLTIAVCGAVLFAANIGPTEEIAIIALETSSIKLLGLALGSLLLGGVILSYSNFARAREIAAVSGLESVFVDAVITYAVALFVSAAMLWSLGRFEGAALVSCVSQIVVLGLAAALGASAGRLLLQ